MENISGALKFYRSIINPEFIESLKSSKEAGVENSRSSIFSSVVVIWLMIFQRISSDKTLAAAIDEIRSGESRELLDQGSSKVRAEKISGATGGYSQGRQRVSVEVVEKVTDAISNSIINTYKKQRVHGYKVYVVDGSTVHLPYTQENIKLYPQYRNQFGAAHYPLVRIGVVTDAVTGVALRPSYGAYNPPACGTSGGCPTKQQTSGSSFNYTK